MKPSEPDTIEVADEHIKKQAIAYYRSSSERQSENSIELQRAHVRAWAAKNGIEIIREYSVAGESGSIGEERQAFDVMIEELEKSFHIGYVLCVDASRIGRFQAIENDIQFKKHNKRLIYTGAGNQFGDDSH